MGLYQTIVNWPTHMDYKGQKDAEDLFQYIITAFSVAGFFYGYYIEMLSHAIYIIGAGVLCASLICLPPWPMFQQRPLQWLKRSDYKVETVHGVSKYVKRGGTKT